MRKDEVRTILLIVTCINIIVSCGFWLVLDTETFRPVQDIATSTEKLQEIEQKNVDNESITEAVDNQEFMALENEIVAFTLSENEYLGVLDYDGTSRIRSAIEGYSFYVNNIMVFNFKTGGIYSGFFDNKNTSVSGYSYEITVYYDKYLLNIYNTDKTQAVSYVLSMDSSNNLYIYYEGADATMRLKKV